MSEMLEEGVHNHAQFEVFTPEQEVVRRAFLGRIALENDIDWEPPSLMSPDAVELGFEQTTTWLALGIDRVVRATTQRSRQRTMDIYDDFFDHLRSGRSKAEVLDMLDISPKMYTQRLNRMHELVGLTLAHYEATYPGGHEMLPPRVSEPRIGRLLAGRTSVSRSTAALRLARSDGWSKDELKSGFGEASVAPESSRPPRSRKTIPQPPKSKRQTSTGEQAAPTRARRRQVVLQADEEVALAKRIEVGVFAEKLLDDFDDDQQSVQVGGNTATRAELRMLADDKKEALFEFLERNTGLVYSNARQMRSEIAAVGIDLDREIEEIAEDAKYNEDRGLLHAIMKFDYTKGHKFSTYATYWIKNGIRDAIGARQQISMSGINFQYFRRIRGAYGEALRTQVSARTAEQEALLSNGDPRVAVKAVKLLDLKKKPGTFHALRQLLGTTYTSVHEDRVFDNGHGSKEEELHDPWQLDVAETVTEGVARHTAIREALQTLKENERTAVMHYFGLGVPALAPKEVCEKYGWKQHHEYAWRNSALKKMKPFLEQLVEPE